MNFKELHEQTTIFMDDLKLDSPRYSGFWNFYNNLRNQHQDYFKRATDEKLTPAQFQSIHKNFVNNVKSHIASTDLGNVFVSLKEYLRIVEKYKENAPILEDGLIELHKTLTSLWNQLNQLMRNQNSFQLMLNIINLCQKISDNLMYFRNCSKFLKNAELLLLEDGKPNQDEARLSLEFSVKIRTIFDVKIMLDDLQTMYTEVCLMFQVNEKKYPLSVSKIESGSFWTCIFGEKSVICFMTWFLKESILYLHRNFTKEGKIEQIPMRVENLEKQFNFLQKLKEELPEKKRHIIEEGNEILAKTAALLAKRTQRLIAKEAKLIINDESFEIEASSKTKYLEMTQKLLPDSNASDSSQSLEK